jgi:hypothetical protein
MAQSKINKEVSDMPESGEKEVVKVKVKFLKPHTHWDKEYQAGEIIEMWQYQAARLFKESIAVFVNDAKAEITLPVMAIDAKGTVGDIGRES